MDRGEQVRGLLPTTLVDHRWIICWDELCPKCSSQALRKPERPGSWKSWRACPERRVIRRSVTCTAGEWAEGKSKERSVAEGRWHLAARKLETVLLSAEGCKTRIGFRSSCCAVMSWSPWGKMRENCKVTLTKSELMFVFEGHVEGKGKKQNHLGSVMCYERCWWLESLRRK